MDYKKEYSALYDEFSKSYDLSSMNGANDAQNIETLIDNLILTKQLRSEARRLTEEDASGNIVQIKKLTDAAKDIVDRNMALERQLGIDRKSRKRDDETSVGEYLLYIKSAARDFLEQRLIKVYCPDCTVMVGRISPVHAHTRYLAAFQCSQCSKLVTVERKERDVFFDLVSTDREWRRKFPVEIKKPKRTKADDTSEIEAEMTISEDDTE
jgi:hypothetical protein